MSKTICIAVLTAHSHHDGEEQREQHRGRKRSATKVGKRSATKVGKRSATKVGKGRHKGGKGAPQRWEIYVQGGRT